MAFSLKLRKEEFPVIDIDYDNPDYQRRYQELVAALQKETDEGVAEIKKEGDSKKRKSTKDQIKEYVFIQSNKLLAETKKLQDEYSSQRMTYDEEKVNQLMEEYRALVTAQEKDEVAIAAKINEIKTAKEERVKPKFITRRYSKDEIAEKVANAADILGLTPYLKRKPAALSGGQRQRVALGRAIVRNPKVFLMDEPLSNLDAKLRVQMRSEIAKIHKFVGATTIYVTHDQTEAMTMASRIVCMKDGYIQQIGTPKELFNTPANMFVASFIGNPATNLIHGKFDGKSFVVEGEDFKIDLPPEMIKKLKKYVNKEIVLGARPEDIYVFDDEAVKNPSNIFELTCDISELLGRELVIYNQIGDQRIIIKTTKRDDIVSDSKEKYVLDLSLIHFFDPETTNRI
ncbi:MAG: ABC transporter ATP-binding protein [Bacilli bacterium]